MPQRRRVRHEMADAARLMAFSAAASVGLAGVLWLVVTVAVRSA